MLTIIRTNWTKLSPIAKVAGVIGIVAALFAIWAFSPVLYNRQVAEPFPVSSNAPAMADTAPTAMPAMADAAPTAMPAMADTAPTAMADTAPTAMPAMADAAPTTIPATAVPAPTVMPTVADAAPTVVVPIGPKALGMGTFIAGKTAGDTAAGSATIYQLEDGTRILRLEDFSTTNGPDLVVAFHTAANPESDQGEYLVLAGLKGNQGDQNYELPADFEQSNYSSVVIWCRTFNIVFGYAPLTNS